MNLARLGVAALTATLLLSSATAGATEPTAPSGVLSLAHRGDAHDAPSTPWRLSTRPSPTTPTGSASTSRCPPTAYRGRARRHPDPDDRRRGAVPGTGALPGPGPEPGGDPHPGRRQLARRRPLHGLPRAHPGRGPHRARAQSLRADRRDQGPRPQRGSGRGGTCRAEGAAPAPRVADRRQQPPPRHRELPEQLHRLGLPRRPAHRRTGPRAGAARRRQAGRPGGAPVRTRDRRPPPLADRRPGHGRARGGDAGGHVDARRRRRHAHRPGHRGGRHHQRRPAAAARRPRDRRPDLVGLGLADPPRRRPRGRRTAGGAARHQDHRRGPTRRRGRRTAALAGGHRPGARRRPVDDAGTDRHRLPRSRQRVAEERRRPAGASAERHLDLPAPDRRRPRPLPSWFRSVPRPPRVRCPARPGPPRSGPGRPSARCTTGAGRR